MPIQLTYAPASEEQLQVNAVKIGKYFISHSVDSYYIAGRVLLPVNQVSDLIGVTVESDGDDLVLTSNTLECRLNVSLLPELTSEQFTPADVESKLWTRDQFDTYLDVSFLEALFDGEAEVNYSQMLVKVNTNVDQKPVNVAQAQAATPFFSIQPEYLIEDQYHLSTFPSVDLNLSYGYDNAASESRYDAKLNAYFDTLYQGTELRLNHNDETNNQRLKFFRDFRVADSSASISQVGYELGDIFTTQDNLITGTNIGSGFHLYTGNRNQFNAFNSISLQETVSPGWRGELYRNGQFIAAQTANNENQLVFNNVPAFYGYNRYELKLFGPDGQQEIRTQTYQMGKDQLVENKFDIEFYSINPGKNIIDQDNAATMPYSQASKLGISYGFSQDLTAGFSIQSLDNNTTGDTQNYLTTSLYKQAGAGAFNLELGTEMGEGYGLFGGYSGFWLDKYNISLDFLHFDNFSSQIRSDGSKLDSQVRARISGSTGLWGGFGWSSSLTQQFNRDSSNNLNALLSVTKSIGHGAISGAFSYNQSEGIDRLFNSLYWVNNFKPVSLSVGLNWYPFDNFDIQSSNIEARWATDSRLFQITRLTYQPSSTEKYKLNHQLNWRTRHFTLTSGVTVNEDGDWEVSAGFVTAMGYDYVNQVPRFSHKRSSNSGNLHLLAYLDKDRNGRLSRGDEPLPEIKFAGNSDWRYTETNTYGQAILTGASAAGEQHIAVDLASLKDPFLYPMYEKLSVKSHPGGLNRILLPVVSFSDLEGSVYLQGELGSRGVLGVPVQLMKNDEVIATVSTESDGYYAFSKVAPGQYSLQVDPQYLQQKHWHVRSLPQPINVTEQGDVVWLSDMILGGGEGNGDESKGNGSVNYAHKASITVDSKPFSDNEYFVQIGVFKKARSAEVILSALPKQVDGRAFPTRIFRNSDTGVSYIVVTGFTTENQAMAALRKIRQVPSLHKAFVVSASKFSGNVFQVQLKQGQPVSSVSKTKSTSRKSVTSPTQEAKLQRLQALSGKYVCQLGSYSDVSNINLPEVEAVSDLIVVQRKVGEQNYHALLLLPPAQLTRNELLQMQNYCEQTIHKQTQRRGWWRGWP
ncbi:hypothetical protein KIH87_09405 [Paraneptunicella aestuarii]|uniref:SdrD B-like domain-containing protein n=1 Tax=Paraneptunicella aestuarii TaxID=2831148 RepID=UPI001E46B2F4|nr:SdrD B-like domain-containing protein [Paraneptunicella aestuarii]UAA40529.1 hypothetical protein KIH87_09405 [Paraneptunicella aestuarii]